MSTEQQDTLDSRVHRLMCQLGLEVDSSFESNELLRNIELFQEIDSRFIPRALELTSVCKSSLRHYLNSRIGEFREAEIDAALYNKEFLSTYNGASLILETTCRSHSMHEFSLDAPEMVSRKHPGMPSRHYLNNIAANGDNLIIKAQLAFRPDTLGISIDETNYYYHPLAVAFHVLDASANEERFLAEAPDFIVWAGEHEDMPLILATALKRRTIDRGNIEAIIKITEETESAFQSGVI